MNDYVGFLVYILHTYLLINCLSLKKYIFVIAKVSFL